MLRRLYYGLIKYLDLGAPFARDTEEGCEEFVCSTLMICPEANGEYIVTDGNWYYHRADSREEAYRAVKRQLARHLRAYRECYIDDIPD